ncbi:alpha/beta hydrolase [Bailinhaonella thermotolerans]|uniref:Alpha/beta hydrolase n=2 Tax=Bailinhaonella thermotolerans TaxID=1070861 RepID=A0A3A4A451_9ACTN|nr:alpha/beta hydrolase [Bailinhaonella thermotolerans]
MVVLVGVAGTAEGATRAAAPPGEPATGAAGTAEHAAAGLAGAPEHGISWIRAGGRTPFALTPTATPPRETLKWRPCGKKARTAASPQCADLRVPLDPARPDGERITLALSRFRATGAARGSDHLGVLLVNPGGPGAAGRSMAGHVSAKLPADLAKRFDVVGFDPRGVGGSRPRLSCVSPDAYFRAPRPDHEPADAAAENRLRQRAKRYADACRAKNARLLPHTTTVNTAHDMDAIRAALGEDKISYLGYSYGSYLGAVYATLYPERVRRLVLDSVVDPGQVWYESNMRQSEAFDARHRDFLAWVARNHRTYRLGDTLAKTSAAWYGMRKRVTARPAAGIVGARELTDIYTTGGYSDAVWPDLAAAFSAYVRKAQAQPLVKAYERFAKVGVGGENSYAGYLANECRDAAWPRDWRRWHADTARLHRRAPFLAWVNTWYNAPCAVWPQPGRRPFDVRGSHRLPPILMFQARRDPATPFQGAVRMRELFPTARLIAETGGNHGVTLSGNTCVDKHLTDYLRDGRAGQVRRTNTAWDARCEALPAPKPARHMSLELPRRLELARLLRR